MRIERCVAASTIAFQTVLAPAMAADIARPIYKAAPAATIYNWSGFYVGGTAGAAWTKADTRLGIVNGADPLYNAPDIPGLQALGSSDLSETHAVFGGKLGYNWQWNAFVFGLEGDIASFRFNKSVAARPTSDPFPSNPHPLNAAAFDSNVSTSWLATIRGRTGYAVDNTLFYVTGGAAFANVGFSNAYVGRSPNGFGLEFESASTSQTRLGWAVGAGIDYAVAANWIVSVEYLHVDVGSTTATGSVVEDTRTATFNFSTKLTSDIVRGGISYKF